jgi:exodeoxyribonuclease V gamma subunit
VIKHLTHNGRKVYELGKLSYWQWLDIWLHHLVLNAIDHVPCPRYTTIYGLEKVSNKDKQLKPVVYRLEPVVDAQAQLAQLLAWYWQGLSIPLPFFPKTAFNLIEQKAQQVATVMSTWEGSGGFTGESEKPEYCLLYRDVNPLEMQTEAFEAIARGIFGRLFAARTKLH